MAAWLAFVLVVVGGLGIYAAWTAGRLDRLHLRLDAARTGLDVALAYRAGVAVSAGVTNCASGRLEATSAAIDLTHGRERAENSVSRAIREALETPGQLTPDQRKALLDAVTRAGFARRFHNDAVRDALVLRRRRMVRLLHLFGTASRPQYFEIDDVADLQSGEISDVARVSAPYD